MALSQTLLLLSLICFTGFAEAQEPLLTPEEGDSGASGSEKLVPSVLVGIFMAIYVAYYFTNASSKPQLVTRENGALHQFLLKNCAFVAERYAPPIWCYEARMQTVLRGYFRPHHSKLPYRRDTVHMADGGELFIHWIDNDVNNAKYPDAISRPTVLFLPGLTGNYDDDYVKNMVIQVEQRGYRAVVCNYRGIAGSVLKTPKLYCAVSTGDVHSVINHIELAYPKAPIIAVGVSLGGIMLFNYLAKYGQNSKLLAAFIASACWNMVASCDSLEKPINWLLFNRYLSSQLKKTFSVHKDMLAQSDGQYDFDRVLQAKTIRDFDDQLTAKMFGYASAEDYYNDATLTHKTNLVHTPVVCLNAADDPFAPLNTLPIDTLYQCERVAMVLTSRGGHIGFLEGFLAPRSSLLERAVGQYATAVFENIEDWKNVTRT